jgi:hypothetical protein
MASSWLRAIHPPELRSRATDFRGVIESWTPQDIDLHGTAVALDQPVNLRWRVGVVAPVDVSLQGHEVGHRQDGALHCKAGLQDIASLDIFLVAAAPARGTDPEKTSAPGIKNGPENAGTVHPGQAAPVDGPVPGDQGDAIQIADDAVIGNGLVILNVHP